MTGASGHIESSLAQAKFRLLAATGGPSRVNSELPFMWKRKDPTGGKEQFVSKMRSKQPVAWGTCPGAMTLHLFIASSVGKKWFHKQRNLEENGIWTLGGQRVLPPGFLPLPSLESWWGGWAVGEGVCVDTGGGNQGGWV